MAHTYADLIADASEQGWRVVKSGGGHLKWYSPNGGFVISAFTPSDRRARQNHLTIMRRYGFVPTPTNGHPKGKRPRA